MLSENIGTRVEDMDSIFMSGSIVYEIGYFSIVTDYHYLKDISFKYGDDSFSRKYRVLYVIDPAKNNYILMHHDTHNMKIPIEFMNDNDAIVFRVFNESVMLSVEYIYHDSIKNTISYINEHGLHNVMAIYIPSQDIWLNDYTMYSIRNNMIIRDASTKLSINYEDINIRTDKIPIFKMFKFRSFRIVYIKKGEYVQLYLVAVYTNQIGFILTAIKFICSIRLPKDEAAVFCYYIYEVKKLLSRTKMITIKSIQGDD